MPDLTILLTHTSILGPTFGYTASLLERTILEQGVSVLEESPIMPEQLPALPELPELPEVFEPYVPDPFAPDDPAPDNGAPAPEPQ